jgi:hypothetical protein
MYFEAPGIIKELKENEVFVFGSNEAGRHGRGAAFTAKKWGARNGQGVGHFGQTYAIPTKDANLKVLPIRKIFEYTYQFIQYAISRKDLVFLVTKVGCGLAGFEPREIAPLFSGAYNEKNILLPKEFIEALRLYNFE